MKDIFMNFINFNNYTWMVYLLDIWDACEDWDIEYLKNILINDEILEF